MAGFTVDSRGMGEMLNAPFMVAHMRIRAEKAAAFARTTAPVDETGPHPGRYRDSIRAEAGTGGGVKGDRAEGRVIAESPEAVYVEFQNGDKTLRRSIDAMRD